MKKLALNVMLGVLWAAGNLQAEIEDNIIPIVGREFRDHYSLQLRGLSLDAEGELCEIYVWDSTCDSSAYGEITITNLEDSSTIFHRRYDIPYDYYNPGGFGETIILPYNTVLQINIRGQEFSHFSAIFGDEVVAHGSAYHGEYPNWTDTLTIQEPPGEGPYISSIEPSSGAPGIEVTISGINFKANVFGWVNFGGKFISVPAESWSDNEVVVKVPSGKGMADVRVIKGTEWSNPVNFTYNDPFIQQVHPSSGRPGEEVTISGKDFGYKNGSAFFWVEFGKSTCLTTSPWTDTEIVTKAPSDYGTGETDRKILMWLIKIIKRGLTADIPGFILDTIELLAEAGVAIRPSESKIIVDVKVTTPVGTTNTEKFTYLVQEIIEAHLSSPGGLRTYDSQGNVTGIVNGEMKEEIPYSYCDDNTILIVYATGSYIYEVLGTQEGSYGLIISSVNGGEEITFVATEIPTSIGSRHVYTVDWQALSSGEEGVILKIDNNGDGFFEKMAIADNDLSYDEFALQTETVIDFEPDTLNLKSQGKFITVYIELPDDFDVSEIGISSLTLNESVPALPKPIEIDDYDSDGINDLMVKFDCQELIEVLEPGEQIIELTGRLSDGRPLGGFDIIRVIH